MSSRVSGLNCGWECSLLCGLWVVNQLVLLHVDEQSKVSQEISTKDGLLYISDAENLW